MTEQQSPSPLYLIVFDPSLNRSGYSVFDITEKPKLIDYGYIQNKHFPSDKTGNKLIHIEMVAQTLKYAYYPHIVIKEEWVGPTSNRFGVSNAAAQTLYLLAGVHNTLTKVFNQQIIENVNNKRFKKQFTGDGNADKDKVAEYVQKYRTRIWSPKRPLIIRVDDESDAIGIGINWLINNQKLKRVD